MQVFPVKIDFVSVEPAAEYNDIGYELQNFVTDAGQTLSGLGGDTKQMGKTAAIYAMTGDYYTCSGTSSAYLLATIGTRQTPIIPYDGMRLRFIANNTNVANATLNPFSLGAQNIVLDETGATNVKAGMIVSGEMTEVIYSASITKYILQKRRTIGVNPFTARRYQTVSQPIPLSTVVTLDFDVSQFDEYSLFSSSTVLQPKFPCQLYITASVGWNYASAPLHAFLQIFLNGVLYKISSSDISTTVPGNDAFVSVSDIVPFNGTTDVVTITATTTTTGLSTVASAETTSITCFLLS